MAISTFSNSRHLKFADMFFFLDEDDILKVYILKNVPLIGTSEKEILDKGMKLLELGFGTCEWLINLNQRLPVYINKIFYRSISDRRLAFNKSTLTERCIAGTYIFELLITDMADEYARVEIITDLTIKADSYDGAISKVREWIGKSYSDFKELEWIVKAQGKMQICDISVTDFLDGKIGCKVQTPESMYNSLEHYYDRTRRI